MGTDIQNGIASQVETAPQPHQGLYDTQAILYDYFLATVKSEPAEDVIRYFKTLFFYQVDSADTPALPALYSLVAANTEEFFRLTIKRICYILINNWHSQRNAAAIAAFFEVFSDSVLHRSASSDMLNRLRRWMINFIQSQDYRELQLHRPDLGQISNSWIQRYTAYLLAAQSHDTSNPHEQRLVAQIQAQRQREQFKFSLAMYTAFGGQSNRRYENPTVLDSHVLPLIRKILIRRGNFDYKYLAKIFLNQSKQAKFSGFKQGLLRYLIFTTPQAAAADLIQRHLASKLSAIYPHRDADILDDALLLRTANRIIDACTIDGAGTISPLLKEALETQDVLTPTVILLRTVLISPCSQAHLDTRIAALINLHAVENEADCHQFIQFLEVLRIASTIHLQDVEYNLVNMSEPTARATPIKQGKAEQYRFFSHSQQAWSDSVAQPPF